MQFFKVIKLSEELLEKKVEHFKEGYTYKHHNANWVKDIHCPQESFIIHKRGEK